MSKEITKHPSVPLNSHVYRRIYSPDDELTGRDGGGSLQPIFQLRTDCYHQEVNFASRRGEELYVSPQVFAPGYTSVVYPENASSTFSLFSSHL